MGQQIHANQLAHSVGRQIISAMGIGVDTVAALTGMVSELSKFSSISTQTLPDIVNRMSSQISTSSQAFETQLALDLDNLKEMARAAADQEVAEATGSLDLLVKSTADKLAKLQELSSSP